MKGTPPVLEVYRCRFCIEENTDRACGFNDCSLDQSYDECHHPLDLKTAQRISACYNALAGVQDPAAFMQSVGSLVLAVKSSRLLTTPSLQARCDEVLEHRQMEIPT